MRGQRLSRRPEGWSWRRGLVVVAGLGVIAAGIVGAGEPVRQTGEFRAAVQCDRDGGDCIGREPGSILGRRTYTTQNSDGTSSFTHREVTWQPNGGEPQSRDVSPEFYARAEPDRPVILRTWRGDVVGLEVPGASDRFAPSVSMAFALWLLLAHAGLGITVWGLLVGRWRGLFFMGYDAFCWMFLAVVPVWIVADILAFGFAFDVGFFVRCVAAVLFAAIAGWMLSISLRTF